jgi:hypothetical protein
VIHYTTFFFSSSFSLGGLINISPQVHSDFWNSNKLDGAGFLLKSLLSYVVKGTSCLVWNPKVYLCVQNSLPLDITLNQINEFAPLYVLYFPTQHSETSNQPTNSTNS